MGKSIKTQLSILDFFKKLNDHEFKQAKIYPTKTLIDFKATLIKNKT
jgi:hypothetical protein